MYFSNSPSEGCRNLEHLNLSWCDQITKDGIEALVKGCSGLKALFLRGCTQVHNCLGDPLGIKFFFWLFEIHEFKKYIVFVVVFCSILQDIYVASVCL